MSAWAREQKHYHLKLSVTEYKKKSREYRILPVPHSWLKNSFHFHCGGFCYGDLWTAKCYKAALTDMRLLGPNWCTGKGFDHHECLHWKKLPHCNGNNIPDGDMILTANGSTKIKVLMGPNMQKKTKYKSLLFYNFTSMILFKPNIAATKSASPWIPSRHAL